MSITIRAAHMGFTFKVAPTRPPSIHHTACASCSQLNPHVSPPLQLSSKNPNRIPSVSSSQPVQTINREEEERGIPRDFVKTLVKFRSRYNYIRVLQISSDSRHPLADSRLLLLDSPGNIQSIIYRNKFLTHTYFDVLATLPPLMPPGPLGILGFGAGTAARLMLNLYSFLVIHGWEIDPSVIEVGRKFFCLSKIEEEYEDRLHMYITNALSARVEEGFAGIMVDLFRKGCLIHELLDPNTWEMLKGRLRRGGRIMVNVGGSCVEPDDSLRGGYSLMKQCLSAMNQVFPRELFVLKMADGKNESSVGLTGEMPDVAKWKMHLHEDLRDYADFWAPFVE